MNNSQLVIKNEANFRRAQEHATANGLEVICLDKGEMMEVQYSVPATDTVGATDNVQATPCQQPQACARPAQQSNLTLADIYLDWFNNFLSLGAFASSYGYTHDEAREAIKWGRIEHEDRVFLCRREALPVDYVNFD